MDIGRRSFMGAVAAAGAGLVAKTAFAATTETIVRPEQFGAKGDGVTNDTDAFAAMSAHVERQGGGTIELRKTTYLVGRQMPGRPDWAFEPATIMAFRKLRRPLVIRGNGARLKCAPGLRYGSFDPHTSQPARLPMPNLREEVRASAYWAMITAVDCGAPIEIGDIELDGSLPQLRLGGPYGDTGIQLPGSGIYLRDNRAAETVRRVHSHHHGQDGIIIDGDSRRPGRSRFEDVICEYNGRQGVSIVGGRGYDFLRCKFNHTGKSALFSAPGAGVDIEAEGGKTNRDISFTNCEFSNNTGCGLVADSGDSADVRFDGCTFIGTTMWSAWPRKPGFVFRNSTFVGTLVHAFSDADPRRATQFHECRFRDDPRLSPTGEIYYAGKESHFVADLAESRNVLFSRCSFLLTHKGLLPWSWHALYSDCTMSQAAPAESYPKGKYLGRNSIRGKVDLYGSIIVGSLTVNGTPVKGQLGGDPW